MNKLSEIISFVLEKRKILISLLLTIGILSSLVDVFILSQRPQTYRSKAASLDKSTLQNIVEFTSPKQFYKLFYDKRYWTVTHLGPSVKFDLNKDYGFGRIDITEGESEKDLDSLVNEIIKASPQAPTKIETTSFNQKSAYLLTFTQKVIGEDIYYQKLVVKNDKKYFVVEKRAPMLIYDQNYLDNLLASFLINNTPNQVKGISNVMADLTTVELVDLIRPSIVNVVYYYCLDIINLDSKQSMLLKPKYQFCSTSKGSGFIVAESGIFATNGHVVKVFPEEGLITNLLNPSSTDFTHDLIRGIHLSKGQTPNSNQIDEFYQELNLNPQYIDRFLTEMFDMISKKIISVSITNEKYYVNVGKEPIKVDYQSNTVIPSQTTYSAMLLGFNYPNKYSYEAIVNKSYTRSADVALLKIDKSNLSFPALELGSTYNLREGSEVIIAGYPTLVEGDDDPRAAISYKTSTKPTITRGIVSSIKQDLSGKTVIQTDASIDHGNSGGPAFNSLAQVIGIATFMNESQTGNFNFLRDVAELKELMGKNKVDNQLEEVSKLWREGLISFNSQYYQKAMKDFKTVKTLTKTHPTVDEFIALSEESIKEGESLEGLLGLIKSKYSNFLLVVFGGISVICFISAGFLTVLPVFAKKDTYVR